MDNGSRYVGLDVHRDTISVAVCDTRCTDHPITRSIAPHPVIFNFLLQTKALTPFDPCVTQA
jgi:hypothetical protein